MPKSIFVISDLHLGGSTGFQMCPPATRERLAAFIRWVSSQKNPDRKIHLVLAGDIVDFLAEEPFQEFTGTDLAATNKLAQIFEHTSHSEPEKDIWSALADFVASGCELTLMLGNHDIELSLPGPRRLLLEKLGGRHVEFLYDNQAFVDGPVIIEHGNRYDAFNVVPHDGLRQVRSALSRKEDPPELPRIPGSAIVTIFMNRLKKEYPFIDLLKPETEAMIPLLAVLDPSVLKELKGIYKLPLLTLTGNLIDSARGRRDLGMISYDISETPDVEKSFYLAEAERLVGEMESDEINFDRGAIDYGTIASFSSPMLTIKAFLEEWKAKREKENRENQINRLYQALRLFADAQKLAFDTNEESKAYLKPAKAFAKNGFKVIVFGHTHLAKRVPIETETGESAVYLNSGTWADLMRLPDSMLEDDEAAAKADLTQFANDLMNDNLDPYRMQIPTFARIDLDGDQVVNADVFTFQDKHTINPIMNKKGESK
ncbi:MAG: metallophosphoesterase [Acidobacteria bacterium]|nr:metallophosphoesterase [Acidobacteriota bacterium]